MIVRIREIATLPNLVLRVVFDDGSAVLYDVAEDVRAIPSFEPLASEPRLFDAVQLDESRTCVFWNDAIDLPSDAIYEYGTPIA